MLSPLVEPLYPRNWTGLSTASWSVPAGYFMIATGMSLADRVDTDAVDTPLPPVLICITFEESTTTVAYQSLSALAPTPGAMLFLADTSTSIPSLSIFPAAISYCV